MMLVHSAISSKRKADLAGAILLSLVGLAVGLFAVGATLVLAGPQTWYYASHFGPPDGRRIQPQPDSWSQEALVIAAQYPLVVVAALVSVALFVACVALAGMRDGREHAVKSVIAGVGSCFVLLVLLTLASGPW